MNGEHFRIKDRRIAMAMIHAGVRLAPKDEGGPVVNSYTPSFLRSVGILPQKSVSLLEFERGVIEAKRRKIHGTITYLFVRDARFLEFWNEWKRCERIARAASTVDKVPDFGKVTRTVEELTREAYIRATNEQRIERELPWTQDCTCDATTLKHTPETFDLPQAQLDKLKEAYGGSIPFGETTGSGKRWTLGLSNEARAALGIHPKPL